MSRCAPRFDPLGSFPGSRSRRRCQLTRAPPPPAAPTAPSPPGPLRARPPPRVTPGAGYHAEDQHIWRHRRHGLRLVQGRLRRTAICSRVPRRGERRPSSLFCAARAACPPPGRAALAPGRLAYTARLCAPLPSHDPPRHPTLQPQTVTGGQFLQLAGSPLPQPALLPHHPKSSHPPPPHTHNLRRSPAASSSSWPAPAA